VSTSDQTADSAAHRAWMREPVTQPRFKWLRLEARLQRARQQRDLARESYARLCRELFASTIAAGAMKLAAERESELSRVRSQLSDMQHRSWGQDTEIRQLKVLLADKMLARQSVVAQGEAPQASAVQP